MLATALGCAVVASVCLSPTVFAAGTAPKTGAGPSAAVAAAAPGTGAGGAGSAPAQAGALVPAGMRVVANDGKLEMAVNMKTAAFAVIDLRNGYVWNSGLPNPQKYATNQYWRDTIESQFGMGRTTTERTNAINQNNQFNSSQDQATVQVTPIPNGVRDTYTFASDNISFQADLVLQGAHLQVTVPYKSIYESVSNSGSKAPLPLAIAGTPQAAKKGACPRFPPPPPTMSLQLFYFPPECYELANINFLPAFGAGVPGQHGYVVVPDGSGAKINFAKLHPIYTNEYKQPIYGDGTVTPYADEWLPEANMPIFGIVHSSVSHPSHSAAMLGVVTQGAANADIIVVPAGQRANLYMASVRFTYRPQYNALGVGLAQSLKYSWSPIPGNRQVTYYFLDGKNANYSGLALRYRQYLIDTQHATPLKPPAQTPFLLRVLNGAREAGVQFDPFERATTFAQTQQMLQDLKAAGVGSIRATLEGWMTNGQGWTTQPQIWPPDGRLGGVGGLRRLASWSKGHGVQLVLAMGVYHAFQSYGAFNLNADSIHLESQLLLQDFYKAFLISPDFAAHQLYPPIQQKMQALGLAGTDFNYLARDVYPNYQRQHVLTRAQSAAQWMGMVAGARAHLGTAGVQGGNTYAVGAASYFYNAPTTDSGFNYESSAIPFWEIAVHGLALYSGRESNLMSTPAVDNLQMIEDGALPVWELTWQPASVLRYTYYDQLYSSQFSQWSAQAVQQYKQMQQNGYAQLAYVAMTGNSRIAAGVHVTDYANGSKVVVNFNPGPVTLSAQYGGRVVPGHGYIVIKG